MIYADYEYYATVYLGNSIDAADFRRLALRASAFLDYYTQGKAAENPGLDEVKMACCALAEQQQIIEQAQALASKSITTSLELDEAELQSQTVGSWSQTYRSGGDSAGAASSFAANAQASFVKIAQQYLAGTGLLYRGRRCK